MISIVNRILQTDEELIHKLMNSNFSEEIANAKAHAIHSLGILGNNGGALNEYCEIIIKLPGDNAARVQEMQKIAIHAICHCVEYCLFGDERKEE